MVITDGFNGKYDNDIDDKVNLHISGHQVHPSRSKTSTRGRLICCEERKSSFKKKRDYFCTYKNNDKLTLLPLLCIEFMQSQTSS